MFFNKKNKDESLRDGIGKYIVKKFSLGKPKKKTKTNYKPYRYNTQNYSELKKKISELYEIIDTQQKTINTINETSGAINGTIESINKLLSIMSSNVLRVSELASMHDIWIKNMDMNTTAYLKKIDLKIVALALFLSKEIPYEIDKLNEYLDKIKSGNIDVTVQTIKDEIEKLIEDSKPPKDNQD